jgi:hypothetical protein
VVDGGDDLADGCGVVGRGVCCSGSVASDVMTLSIGVTL